MRIKIGFDSNNEPSVEVETDECLVPTVIVTKANGETLRVDLVGELGSFEQIRYEPTEPVDPVEPVPAARLDISQQWPSWLKAAAVCQDKNGTWYAYETMPVRSDCSWNSGLELVFALSAQANKIIDFLLPETWDWTVPIINPNRKE